jgi:hypothetical protein
MKATEFCNFNYRSLQHYLALGIVLQVLYADAIGDSSENIQPASLQASSVENNEVVQTLPSYRSD